MTLACPKCGGTTFNQTRSGSFDEFLQVTFDDKGQIDDQEIADDDTEFHEVSPYSCTACKWEVVDGEECPADDPDEIKAVLKRSVPRNGREKQ